jgi:nitrate/nitrite transporter NarK
MWIAIALVGLTRGLFPLLTVALMDMPEVGPRRMGVAGGLFFSIGEIGGFGGPFIMGVLKDVTGVFLSGIIFLVVVTECSILCAALLKTDKSLAR